MTEIDLDEDDVSPLPPPVVSARRGDIVVFSSGEYSEYGLIGIFRAERDLSAGYLRIVERQANAEVAHLEYGKPAKARNEFLRILVAKGELTEITYSEVYMGDDYSAMRIEPQS